MPPARLLLRLGLQCKLSLRLAQPFARARGGRDLLIELAREPRNLAQRALLRLAVRVECRVPYAAGELLAEVHKTGTVVEEEYEPAGTRVVAFVPPSLRNRLKRYSLE